MKTLLKSNISFFLISYLLVLILLNVLPINGKESTLNNNFTLGLRWDYLGHALVMIPLFPLLMLKYNTLQPLTSDAGGHLTQRVLQSFTRSNLQSFTRSTLPPFTSDKGGYFTRSTLLLISISMILAAILEGLQYFIPYRTFNVNDMVANVFGVEIGIIVYLIYRKQYIIL